MDGFKVFPVGTVHSGEDGVWIEIGETYIPALKGLDGFRHINVLWWFNKYDNAESRNILQTEQPYHGAPETMGIFATRSPMRPNPIALTASEVIGIDYRKGIIRLTFLDADDGTPVLDIKPYTPSFDRVEMPDVPDWCRRWPRSTEESGEFNWDSVFNV